CLQFGGRSTPPSSCAAGPPLLGAAFQGGSQGPPPGSPPDDYILGYFPPNTAIEAGQLFMPANETFIEPVQQPAFQDTAIPFRPAKGNFNFDHLIYAYLVENTGIFEIFSKLLEIWMFSERLPTPSFATQAFLRNTEYLLYGDGVPTMVWTTAGRLRRDEIANRMNIYYRMFGIEVAHAAAISAAHPYSKPEAANRDFIPTFEAFLSEVWKG